MSRKGASMSISTTWIILILFALLLVEVVALQSNKPPNTAPYLIRKLLEEKENGGNSSSIRSLESSLTIITHSAFDGEEHALCRIKGVCRLGESTLLLPQWMKDYSSHISKCGLPQLSYSLTDELDDSNMSTLQLAEEESGISLKDAFRDFDLFGIQPPHGERNLLVQDMTPSILLLDLFKRPWAYSNSTTTLCTTSEGTRCTNEQISGDASLNPMLLVDGRISDTKDYHWPKSFLRLVRNAANGRLLISDLKDMYGWRVRTEAACFRSVIATSVLASDMPPDVLINSNVFFTINGLKRHAVDADGSSGASCNVKALILNRYGKRFIEGAQQLRSAISTYAHELLQRDRRVMLEPEVVFFENSSFHEQVSVIQESDVVIASHGEGNANLIFLRPQAQVFEILPFGFASDTYRNLSRTFGAMYTQVTAQPDEDVFLACVRHFNSDTSVERDTFIEEWSRAAQAFKSDTLRLKRNTESSYMVPDDENDETGLMRLRQCASHQRISVDVKHLARLVARAAAKQCHIQGELDFLRD